MSSDSSSRSRRAASCLSDGFLLSVPASAHTLDGFCDWMPSLPERTRVTYFASQILLDDTWDDVVHHTAVKGEVFATVYSLNKKLELGEFVTVHAPVISEGAGFPARWASTVFVSQAKVLRDWRRQVSTTVSRRSTNRLPPADCVPNDSLRPDDSVTQRLSLPQRCSSARFLRRPRRSTSCPCVRPILYRSRVSARVAVAAQQQRVDLAADPASCGSGTSRKDSVPSRTRFHNANSSFVGRMRSWPSRLFVRQGLSMRAWKSRLRWSPAPLQSSAASSNTCGRTIAVDDAGEIVGPSSSRRTSAPRLVRQAKNVKFAATKAQTHALAGPSFVGLAIRRCAGAASSGSRRARPSS